MKRTFLKCALGALAAACPLVASYSQQSTPVSPWGVAAGHDTSWGPSSWAAAVAAAGVHTVRGFADYPDTFAVLQNNGFKAKGILMWSPDGQPFGFPVNNLDSWASYVRDIVTRYAGSVDSWEVWNEPPNFTADVSPASYAKIVQVAYNTAKAAVPGVRIGLAAKSVHIKWLAESIDAGAKGYYDYITLHPYETAGLVRQGWEGEYMAIAPTVRKMLAQKDPSRANVPIEFTEVGIPTNWPARTFSYAVPEPVQADLLVKYYTMGIAQGVSQIDWFEAWDGDTPDPATSGAPFGLITRDSRKRPVYYALKSLVGYLGQNPSYLGWTNFGGAGYGFYFRRGQIVVLVGWANSDQQIPLNFSTGLVAVTPGTFASKRVTSLQLTSSPRIVLADPGTSETVTWAQDAQQSRSKPFPWGGDYSGVSSVSIVAGQPDQGLHWVNKPGLVSIDGVPAYSMVGQSGAAFTVDPNFLSWTSQRITVAAVVRKVGDGAAGFNLKYESTAPISTTDGNGFNYGPNCWCNVPAGGPTTFTWVLDNPRFVGMFGVNLTLDSDSAQYANYAIERITVTKTP